MKLGYTVGVVSKAASCLGDAFRDLKTKTIHTHVEGKKFV